MKINISTLYIIILLTSLSSFAQEKEVNKCSVPKSNGGKYKIASESRLVGKSGEIILEIVIKPKNFTKEYMTEAAKRIRAEYCNDDVLYVSIFDSEKAIRGWHLDWMESKGKIDRRRGVYLLNKRTEEEIIEFSTQPGNPINEVKLTLQIK
jgi:hypothetical protein